MVDLKKFINEAIDNFINERKISYMPNSKTVEVKQKCRLGGNADGTSEPCNQGDINNLTLKSIS